MLADEIINNILKKKPNKSKETNSDKNSNR